MSGPSRLHDLLISCEAMTPGEIKSLGAGLLISHGYALSPFGLAYIAWTSRGICHMAFCQCPDRSLEEALKIRWPSASFVRDDNEAAKYIDKIFQINGKNNHYILS